MPFIGRSGKLHLRMHLSYYKNKAWYSQERSPKRDKLGTEMGREKGKKEERIYIVLEVYGYAGFRTEYMTGTTVSNKIPCYS